MSLGCNTLLTASSFWQVPHHTNWFFKFEHMLSAILATAPLMDAAKEQMREATEGPNKFKSGLPIDFAHFARFAVSSRDQEPYVGFMHGGVPDGYKSEFKQAMTPGDGYDLRTTRPFSREGMHYDDDKDLCGACKKTPDKALSCSRCKCQVYCDRTCQRKDYKRHKFICRTPENAKALEEDSAMWTNQFYARAVVACDTSKCNPS